MASDDTEWRILLRASGHASGTDDSRSKPWQEILASAAKVTGREIASLDDGVVLAFRDVEDAVAGAVSTVREAVASGALPVVAIHLVPPRRHEEGFVRQDLRAVERMCESAQPGQILLSAAAHRALTTLPEGCSLVDGGAVPAADGSPPLLVHRLEVPGIVASTPSVVGDERGVSLPVPRTPTVGRDRELDELAELVQVSGYRLITLTGTGGTGKTRLATALSQRLAADFKDAVAFVPLAAAHSASDMWTGMSTVMDVPADGQLPPEFFEFVKDKAQLVLLDNLEQIPDAPGVVDQLLGVAPRMVVLATSRAPLHVTGEYTYPVAPLEVPTRSSLPEIAASASVQLFVDAAKRVRKGFELDETNAADVAEICRGLDGLPLAVELAAARSRMLSPANILAHLTNTLDLEATDTGRPERQRTLRDTIAWSHSLLNPDDQRLLEILGVFAGGFSLATADTVARPLMADSGVAQSLERLVDASLVNIDLTGAEARFTMLETIRAYSIDKLNQTGILESARRAHAQYFYNRAKVIFEGAYTDQGPRLRREFRTELPNFRVLAREEAALVTDQMYGTLVVPPRHVIALLAPCAEISLAWSDTQQWLTRAVQDDFADLDAVGSTACTARLGCVLTMLQRLVEGETYLRAGLAMTKDLQLKLKASYIPHPRWVDPDRIEVVSLNYMTLNAESRRDWNAAQEAATRLLELEPGSHRALALLGRIAMRRGEYEQARQYLERSLAHVRESGDDIYELVGLTLDLADVDVSARRLREAHTRVHESLQTLLELNDTDLLVFAAEILAAAVGGDEPKLAARALGSVAARRLTENMPASELDASDLADHLADARAILTPQEWELLELEGRGEDLTVLIQEMAAVSLP